MTPAIAQEETEVVPFGATQTQKKLSPSFRSTFHLGTEAGNNNAYGSFYSFVPFSQTPGVATFFWEGHFHGLTGSGGQAGSIHTGYRRLLTNQNMVLGGYAGWNIRHTSANETFHQLGLGAELLGDKWETRFNGYFPLGDSSRAIATSDNGTGFIVNDFSFVGNQLLLSGQAQSQTVVSEFALGGFDLEGGYQLKQWSNGNLYGYLGLYLLDSTETDAVVGVRGRLEAEIDNIVAGMTVQSDGEFGENVQFSVGVTFGGNQGRRQEETEAESVLARLGGEIERRNLIAIDRKTTTQTILDNQFITRAATNPATGEAWRFIHVQDGGNSSGTFEDPYGEVTDAVAEIGTTGTANDIIYVRSGDRSGMAGFTIPANVQVLSSGLNQTIQTTERGMFQLPGSGTGVQPLVQGTVVMGSNTMLSGFEIQTANREEHGVQAENINNFTINNNTIVTQGDNALGLLLKASTDMTLSNGSVSDNNILTTGSRANSIFLDSRDDAALSNISIMNNTISTQGRSSRALLMLGSNNARFQDNAITDNTITTTGRGADGLLIEGGDRAEITGTFVARNMISAQSDFADGLILLGLDEAKVDRNSLVSNTITTSGLGAEGIIIRGDDNAEVSHTSASNNLISTQGEGARGLFLWGTENAKVQNTLISGNTISTSGDRATGIIVSITGRDTDNNVEINDTSIVNNILSTQGMEADGIQVTGFEKVSINNISFTNNSVRQAGRHSFRFQPAFNSQICVAELRGNTSTMPNVAGNGGNDLSFLASSNGSISVVDFMNIATANFGFDDIAGIPDSAPVACP